MFIGCMIVLSVACVGLALVPTNAYWLLMLLRCLQAAGSASTVALGTSAVPHASRKFLTHYGTGAGVIADIAAPAERGSFFGMWNIGPMVGPSIGPVLGGVLAENLGWRCAKGPCDPQRRADAIQVHLLVSVYRGRRMCRYHGSVRSQSTAPSMYTFSLRVTDCSQRRSARS